MGTIKNKPPFAKIYTVSSIDETPDFPVDFDVVGSYTSRGDAIRECANYILERIQVRPDIRHTLLFDQSHPNLRDALKRQFHMEWVERVLSYSGADFSWKNNESYQDLRKFLFNYFLDEIGMWSCYSMYSMAYGMFRFDITENDVEGVQDAWACITSGDSDDHDEQFEQPFPEVFLSQKEAVKCAIDDLRGYLNDAEPQYIKDILKEARASFRRYGKFSYTLNDSAVRRWDIWYTPITLSGKLSQIEKARKEKGDGK